VRDLIDQLAFLDSAVHLLMEGLHQQKHHNKTSKLQLLEWLLLKKECLTTEKYSDDWMKVMVAVIAI